MAEKCCVRKRSACRLQKRAIDPLELEFQVFGRGEVLLIAKPSLQPPF